MVCAERYLEADSLLVGSHRPTQGVTPLHPTCTSRGRQVSVKVDYKVCEQIFTESNENSDLCN